MNEKKVNLIKCCLIFIFSINLFANDFEIKLLRVYDGDTIKVDIINCDIPIFCKNIGIRLKSINAPEIRTKNLKEKKAGFKAKEALKKFLDKKNIKLQNCTRGKYFRLVCDVFANNKNVSEFMLENGYVDKYK